jgi:hypothetical protein
MTSLLESLNDSIVEDTIIESLYYKFVDLEMAVQEGLTYNEARSAIGNLLEDNDVDLIVDVLDGGPFSRVSRIADRLEPIRTHRTNLQEAINVMDRASALNQFRQSVFGDTVNPVVNGPRQASTFRPRARRRNIRRYSRI